MTVTSWGLAWHGLAGVAVHGPAWPLTFLDSQVVAHAELKPEWTPRELRHSFVSLLSDHGIPLERIALLVGHSSQATTEAVYRKQLRSVITQGAEAMDDIFAEEQEGEEGTEGQEGGDAVA
ncbi:MULTISPECIES: tyrosine-type recombinase/integrase [unclassified Streptomyces]|uniref:Tyrosine-type recombinase/integrase n=1 Tax=Streptomyces doudnae TaxID=3075536 RepID=A0ABD5EWB3_9ACTN|nr:MULTISPECIES: tyrosine-type recombinase/integrase [unclassified Streptomyces]MDT0438998.1 tyrosine-type recombinase/integrase [Streptomyces sp. DSM 41981]SCD35641.1 Phage integrase family protein [Streptomyces sp. SolWspMP-5a-2]